MSAGPGVRHSEHNASKTDPVHFLQIWIQPKAAGLPAGYEQKFFSEEDKRGVLRLVASPDGADGSVRIQQDVRMYASLIARDQTVQHTIASGRKGWLHVVTGAVSVNGRALEAGDGLAIEGEEALRVSSESKGEVLLFDMAP